MRLIATTLLVLLGLLTSCTSEYEERLEEAKKLKERYLLVEESHFLTPNKELIKEMEEIDHKIHFLAKVSGNEELFLKQVKEY